jgi:phosphatidylinositol alpha 1,6-mannosyltransferase
LNACRRVAFLPDTFHEVNGVAHTSRQLEAFARRRQIPFLSVHSGPSPDVTTEGPVTILELKRGPFSFPLDTHLDCDPFLFRHASSVIKHVQQIRAELIHITGPGDMGMLGCYVARRLKLPLVIGWHTSLHEYAAKRFSRLFGFGSPYLQSAIAQITETQTLRVLRRFYSKADAVFAPNRELVSFLQELTGRPTYLMARGVDTRLFTPARRDRSSTQFRIGYVGRLTPEKNVRFLADLARSLACSARREFEFEIIGQGSQLEWLKANVPQARFPGVLIGEQLARAYANMDLFVFPSTTDTFGNVILEALASGVPCVVTSSGGPKFLVQSGVTGYVAADFPDFTRCVGGLVNNLDTHHAMRESARHYACGLSWDSVFEKVLRSYDTCFDAGLSRRSVPANRGRACLSA